MNIDVMSALRKLHGTLMASCRVAQSDLKTALTAIQNEDEQRQKATPAKQNEKMKKRRTPLAQSGES